MKTVAITITGTVQAWASGHLCIGWRTSLVFMAQFETAGHGVSIEATASSELLETFISRIKSNPAASGSYPLS